MIIIYCLSEKAEKKIISREEKMNIPQYEFLDSENQVADTYFQEILKFFWIFGFL